jgi:alanine racemase
MHRLGLSASDLKRLLEADFSYIRWSLIMTQLACADEPTHPMNIKQKTLFNSLRPHFKDAKFSLVDTKGILLGPDYHYDVIRPGRALYGPLCGYENHSLMQCITIKAKILQIQELNPGQTIGYGCTFTANKCMKIATLSLGYTDGLSRRLSGRNAYAVINGKKAPFVGRISMDLTTVDITDIPNVNMYDWATIAGNDAMAIDDIAQLINTDSREVLVTLGDRFNKFYTE